MTSSSPEPASSAAVVVTQDAPLALAPTLLDKIAMMSAGDDCELSGTAAMHCSLGAPRCSWDSQCDNYCGGPGYGACESFCCACLG